jgi:hypothetical protein
MLTRRIAIAVLSIIVASFAVPFTVYVVWFYKLTTTEAETDVSLPFLLRLNPNPSSLTFYSNAQYVAILPKAMYRGTSTNVSVHWDDVHTLTGLQVYDPSIKSLSPYSGENPFTSKDTSFYPMTEMGVRDWAQKVRCSLEAPDYDVVTMNGSGEICNFLVSPKIAGKPLLVLTVETPYELDIISTDVSGSDFRSYVRDGAPSGAFSWYAASAEPNLIDLTVPVDEPPQSLGSSISTFLGIVTAMTTLILFVQPSGQREKQSPTDKLLKDLSADTPDDLTKNTS